MADSDWGEITTSRSRQWYSMLAWVKASDRRTDILLSLDEGPKNSTDFAEAWDVTPEAVQYHLKQLRRGGSNGEYPPLIENVTPERQQYKLYDLTEKGREVAQAIE